MIKRLFWFAIGSLIAMLFCFNEVYAESVPITGIGASIGLEQSGANMTYCSLITNSTNNVCNWNNGRYRYWLMSIIPSYMTPGQYYTLNTSFIIRYTSNNKNTYFKNGHFCFNGKCSELIVTEHVQQEAYNPNTDKYQRFSYLQIESVLQIGAISENSWENYFAVDFLSDNTVELLEVAPHIVMLTTMTSADAEIEANRQNAQAQINAQKEQTDKLLNSNINDNEILSKFDLYNSVLQKNGTITNLMVLPITLWTTVYDSVGQECHPFNLGNMLGTDLTLPCLNIENVLGSTLWNTIDVLFTGFFIFVISKKMILVFDKFSSLQEGDVISD